MPNCEISKAALGRIPAYLRYLRSLPPNIRNISATAIARELGFGEVQVRKDLSSLCGSGKPKTGYQTTVLIYSLGSFLDRKNGTAVIVGAGKLGRALLDYEGFSDYGLKIAAAFDIAVSETEYSPKGNPIFEIGMMSPFCAENDVNIGIIAVPVGAAQEACDCLAKNGIRAIWCFAPCRLTKPDGVVIQYENMALSLAHLKMQIK